MAANPGPGFLCHSCAKSSGADPFKKPAAPRKRKDPADKRKVTSYEETERVQSLAKMCIEVRDSLYREEPVDCIRHPLSIPATCITSLTVGKYY
jgi:hypothetical protein